MDAGRLTAADLPEPLLLRELEEGAARRECAAIVSVTAAGREDAVAFYESHGRDSRPCQGFLGRLGAASSGRSG